jgi:hypothetical protein
LKVNPYVTKKIKAKDIVEKLPTIARLMVAFKIGKDLETPVKNQAIQILHEMLKRYQQNDENTCILAWKEKDMDVEAIMKPADIPLKLSELKTYYAEGMWPKSGSTCWFKLRVGCSTNKLHLTCSPDSDSHDFFADTSHLAYLATVQDSDDTVDLCDFIHSGAFIDSASFKIQLRQALHSLNKNTFSFGCQIKKTKEIQEPKNVKDWLLKLNMILHLEVDPTPKL